MPPILVLTLALAFTSVLWARESRRYQHVSRAIWIPLTWLLILGSRSVTAWLNLESPRTVDDLLEGSPIDRLVFIALMASALVVVARRQAALKDALRSNPWFLLLFVYGALSLLWSDFPFVAFKRWSKSLGDPLMALVIISERYPAAALATLLRRCAFLLLPLSVVFIKYFPELGRAYDAWSGAVYHTGVTTNKNLLGYLLLVFGLFFVSELLTRNRASRNPSTPRSVRRIEAAVAAMFLVIIAWLFSMADSQTPLIALVVGSAVVIGTGTKIVRRNFGAIVVATLVVVGALELLFNLGDTVLGVVGRDATLTGRTEIWTSALALAANPWLGAGFESFWLGDRLRAMWEQYPVFRPNQAHNGFLQIYLNLGWIGLFVCGGVLVASYRAMRDRLTDVVVHEQAGWDEATLARFGVGYLVAFLLYNVTEAVFQPLNFLFVIFVILAIRMPLRMPRAVLAASPRAGQASSDRRIPGRPIVEPAWSRSSRRRVLDTSVRWETRQPEFVCADREPRHARRR